MKNASVLKELRLGFMALLKWVPQTLIVGGILGFVGTAFHCSVDLATMFRLEHPWVIWLMPVGGLLIAVLYQLLKLENDPGTNLILRSVYSDEKIPLRMAPLIFAATVITHLTGGSSGREGAALQLGGSIAYEVGEIMHLSRKDVTILTMCGMSAAFSALFGTPLTAAIFSVEVISVGVMYHCALVPCLFSSLIGFGIAQFFHVPPTMFEISGIPELGILTVLQTVGLGILCALASILFCLSMHTSASFYQKYLPNPRIRAAVGGALVLGLTLLLGSQTYNGAGMSTIEQAMAGTALPWDFLFKILFTALTLGAGFKGGEIVPVFFVGSTFGCVAAPLPDWLPYSAALSTVRLPPSSFLWNYLAQRD